MCAVINKWEKPFHIERGDVYMANISNTNLEQGVQSGYRPLAVTQSNWQNEKSASILVVPGTSELKKTNMRTHVVLPMIKGLPKQTMFCAEQRFTVNADQLDRFCCKLPNDIMKQITRACRYAERGEIIRCRKKRR